MSDTTDRIADLTDIIADNPVTVTVYRRSAGAANETEVDSFKGRIDLTSVRVALDTISTMGTFSRQNHVLVYHTTEADLRHGDEVWAEWDDGRSATFRVLSFQSYAWKKEAVMELVN